MLISDSSYALPSGVRRGPTHFQTNLQLSCEMTGKITGMWNFHWDQSWTKSTRKCLDNIGRTWKEVVQCPELKSRKWKKTYYILSVFTLLLIWHMQEVKHTEHLLKYSINQKERKKQIFLARAVTFFFNKSNLLVEAFDISAWYRFHFQDRNYSMVLRKKKKKKKKMKRKDINYAVCFNY